MANGIPDWFLFLSLFSMLTAAFFCAVANARFYCPRCESNLTRSFVRPLPWWGAAVRYCPFCGLDLESVDASEIFNDGFKGSTEGRDGLQN